MVTILPQVKTATVVVRAVLVTGSDSRGNEFFYFRSGDKWYDGYNDVEASIEYIRKHVFPNVQFVRYAVSGGLYHKLYRSEWVEMGCPLDLPKSVVVELMDTQPHPVVQAQEVEREIDRTDSVKHVVVSAKPVKVTVSRSWAERHLNVDVNGFEAELDKAFGKGKWILA